MSNGDAKVNKIKVDWDKLDKVFCDLKTNQKHEIEVQREAIPLIFIPGIMGSVLRLKNTDGSGRGANGLPNMRWDPSGKWFMLSNYSGESGATRRDMLIGSDFNKDFLEVHNSSPIGNGFQGVSSDSYLEYLTFLQNPEIFGPLTKIFDFPVFAVGYNWTDTNTNSGKELSKRIDEIISEAKKNTGLCEKVILITHSMGGLVSRSASELAGAKSKILGIVHGVQPATGAAAAYWRIKAGFEGCNMASRVLGNNAHTTTPILGNMPGGLELLPNQFYQDNAGRKQWLIVTEKGKEIIAEPKLDPYNDIYRVKGTGDETKHPDRKYWGLVDPDLLNPGKKKIHTIDSNTNEFDANDSVTGEDPWKKYLKVLKLAEKFNINLKKQHHPDTYTFHGTGHTTADNVVMETESVWVEWDSYPKRGFRGRFKNNQGEARRALLQEPAGTGDGTVSISSGSFLDSIAVTPPKPEGKEAEHEPAYKTDGLKDFSLKAIISLCTRHYEKKRGVKVVF